MRVMGIRLGRDNDSGVISLSLNDITLGVYVFQDKIIDLYTSQADAALGQIEEFILWTHLEHEDHDYEIYAEHAAQSPNPAATGPNYNIIVLGVVDQYPLESGDVSYKFKFRHTEHGNIFEKNSTIENVTDIIEYQSIAADGSNREFMMSGNNRVFALNRIGVGTSLETAIWYELYATGFSWGYNSPNYDNQEISSEGYTGVKFDFAPAVGFVFFEYYPRFNRVVVESKIHQPYDLSDGYVDRLHTVRGLDYNVEFIGKV